MKTPRTLKEYYANDEVIKKTVNDLMSMTVGRIRDIIGEQSSFYLIANDAFINEGFDMTTAWDMTMWELVSLMENSKTSYAYSYKPNGSDEVISSYENYLYYGENLTIGLYNNRSKIREIDRFMKLPMERLLSVLFKDNKYFCNRYRRELITRYKNICNSETCDLETMCMETLIENLNRSGKKIWIPGEGPIERYREKRMNQCRVNAMLMIEMISRSKLCQCDVVCIRQKYMEDTETFFDDEQYLAAEEAAESTSERKEK